MKIIKFLSLIVIIIALSCNQVSEKLPEEQHHPFHLKEGERNVLLLKNHSNKTLHFLFKLNGHFFLSQEELLAKLGEDPEEAKKDIWSWIFQHSKPFPPSTNQLWWNEPQLFINSSGFGYCDNRSIVLTDFWGKLGFQSRIWVLEGHVVPEIYSQDLWQMYDPHTGTFFSDSLGLALSVKDIAEKSPYQLSTINPDIFYKQEDPMVKLAYTSKFESQQDNTVHPISEYRSLLSLNPEFILPAGASIECCQTTYFNNGPEAKGMKLILPPGTSGELYLPLILLEAEGSGSLKNQKEKKRLEINGHFIPSNYEFPQKYHIEEITDTTQLLFGINAQLPLFQVGDNQLIIKGQDLTGLEVLNLPTKKPPLTSRIFPQQFELSLEDPLLYQNWQSFRTLLKEKPLPPIQAENIDRYFGIFLKGSTIEEEDKKRLYITYVFRKNQALEYFGEEQFSRLVSNYITGPERLFYFFYQYIFSLNDENYKQAFQALSNKLQRPDASDIPVNK